MTESAPTTSAEPPPPAWEKLKKAELAVLAEREIAGKGWLPQILLRLPEKGRRVSAFPFRD